LIRFQTLPDIPARRNHHPGEGCYPSYPSAASQSAGAPGWNPYGGVMLISVIVVIWILLGSWFYLAFRKIE